MTEMPALTAAATVTTTANLQLPPGWTPQQAGDAELYAATAPGARLSISIQQLTDPRTMIRERVQDAANSVSPVQTTYLELPSGRAILASAAGARGVAQLWLPLPGNEDALVISIVADFPHWTAEATTLVTEIGRRLGLDRSTSVTLRTGPGRPALVAR